VTPDAAKVGDDDSMGHSAELDEAGEVEEHPCKNHSGVLTAVSCGKCGTYICAKCMIFTPVGVRCRPCAQLRPAPQNDVVPTGLIKGSLVAFGISFVGWLIVLNIPFFGWILSIFLGLFIGDMASRAAKRRVNRQLQVAVGTGIVVAFFAARAIIVAADFNSVGLGGFASPTSHLYLQAVFELSIFTLVPLVLATIAAVTRLAR
jgi:hypothetical protein